MADEAAELVNDGNAEGSGLDQQEANGNGPSSQPLAAMHEDEDEPAPPVPFREHLFCQVSSAKAEPGSAYRDVLKTMEDAVRSTSLAMGISTFPTRQSVICQTRLHSRIDCFHGIRGFRFTLGFSALQSTLLSGATCVGVIREKRAGCCCQAGGRGILARSEGAGVAPFCIPHVSCPCCQPTCSK